MSELQHPTRRALLGLAGHNSGVGWLCSLLLELGIQVAPADMADAWQAHGDTWRLSPPAFRLLRGVLPAVHRRTEFAFADNLSVQVERDELALLAHPNSPAIVMLRDPRDAALGQWERGGTGASTWEDFLGRTGGNVLGLPPPEAWAVRALLWEALSAHRPLLFVRYEDLRADTAREAARALAFLGLARDDAAIAQAAALSALDRARDVLAQAARDAGAVACYPGKGRCGSGARHLASSLPGRFDGLAGHALRRFGYEGTAPRREIGGFAQVRANAPAHAQAVLERAALDMAGGNLQAALHRLAASVSAVPGGDSSDAALLATLTALHWTNALFPHAPDDSADVPCAFNLFCGIHSAWADDSWVRIAQMRALTLYAPKHAGAYNIWGKALHALGRAQEAEQVFQAACAVGAESAPMRSSLAVLAWQDGRRDEALAQILRAARLDPMEPSVAANLLAMQSALRAA